MNHQQLNILIRGTNWLGDAVMSIPALDRLRRAFPLARLTLIASPVSADIFSSTTLVDEILVYHRKERGATEFLRMVKELRARHYHLALLFQNAFEAALMARLAGIPHQVGYRTQGRGPLLTLGAQRRDDTTSRHQFYDYLHLVDLAVERFGGRAGTAVDTDADVDAGEMVRSPFLSAQDEQREAARGLLPVEDAAMLVALNVGATNSRAKRWPEQRFAELADRLTAEFGARILLLGAPAERDIAARVISQMRSSSAVNLAGKTDLRTLVGVLAGCDLVITNDTGSAHVAAALGRPTLTLFGPTNEFETAPLGPLAEVVRADGIDCARCMLRDCPIDHRCMSRITADDVIERARVYLQHPHTEVETG